jgi:hypothetical protein
MLTSAQENNHLSVVFSTSGVFWTKFEHCMNKIRRILWTDFARAERVVA